MFLNNCPSKFWSLLGVNKLAAWQGNYICTIYLYQNWKPLCWNLKIHDRLILISTEGVLFWGSMLNLLISKLPSTNDCVQLPCRILKKIRLICRLTKRGDQALISISTIQDFPTEVTSNPEMFISGNRQIRLNTVYISTTQNVNKLSASINKYIIYVIYVSCLISWGKPL